MGTIITHDSPWDTIFCKYPLQMVNNMLCGLAVKLSEAWELAVVVCNHQLVCRLQLEMSIPGFIYGGLGTSYCMKVTMS